MAGGGKLTWRVDWPARWKIFGVTVEPFGKDHASKGGSYDTGVRIAREVYGIEPPYPVPYEWLSLAGKGDMSSSKGNVLSIHAMLEVVPPEVLRYLILRVPPQRSIKMDPGLPLLQLIDEYDDVEAKNRDSRALELSAISGIKPVGVPFRHMVTVVQAAQGRHGAVDGDFAAQWLSPRQRRRAAPTRRLCPALVGNLCPRGAALPGSGPAACRPPAS